MCMSQKLDRDASYLPDAVCDGPGEEDPRHDLESCEDHRGRHNSWDMRQKTNIYV